MSKVSVNLDATKLRNLVSKRAYTNKEGQEVVLQEVKFELIQVKEPKLVFEKDNRKVFKTHFAAAIKANKDDETLYIGEGYTTEWANSGEKVDPTAPVEVVAVEVDDDGVPF